MLNLVLFGPPGAGKGTQATKLLEKYSLKHLSTGDILRGEIAAKTELGLKAQEYMKNGQLVPDEVVIGMIDNILEKNKDVKGFIFDGFPRTTPQAEALDKLLSEKGLSITAMLSLEVHDEELKQRLLSRGKVSGRADDQDISVIENRINVYKNETAPLIDYYSKQNKHYGINGVGAIDEIFALLCQTIDKLS